MGSVPVLVVNVVTLVMSIQVLFIVMWQDAKKTQNRAFALLLLAICVWSTGSLLTLALADFAISFAPLAFDVSRLGFMSTTIAVYAFTAASVGLLTRRFQALLGAIVSNARRCSRPIAIAQQPCGCPPVRHRIAKLWRKFLVPQS